MPVFDNEVFRGSQTESTLSGDPGNTLSQDRPVTAEEHYRVADDSATVLSDVQATIADRPVTETSVKKRGNKRIIKAMKLLTSAVATVTIAATLAGSSLPLPPVIQDWIQKPNVYPKFGVADKIDSNHYTDMTSPNSHFFQVRSGDEMYRLVAMDEYLDLMCMEVMPWEDRIGIFICDTRTGKGVPLNISPTPIETDHYDTEAQIYSGPFTAQGSGREYYFLTVRYTHGEEDVYTREEFQALAEEYLSRIEFQPYDPYSWNRVQIGDTMYSDMTDYWAGMRETGDTFDLQFDELHRKSWYDLDSMNYISGTEINGIRWKFYYTYDPELDYWQQKMWCVPQHDDMMIGLSYGNLLSYLGYYDYKDKMDQLPPEAMEKVVDMICSIGLSNYHLLEDAEELPPVDDGSGAGRPGIIEGVVTPGDLQVYKPQPVAGMYPSFEPIVAEMYTRLANPQAPMANAVQAYVGNHSYRIECIEGNVQLMHTGIENIEDSISIIEMYDADLGIPYTMKIAPNGTGLGVGKLSGVMPVNDVRAVEFRIDMYYTDIGDNVDPAEWCRMTMRKLKFTEVNEDDWRYVQIGDAMYSETDRSWYGLGRTDNLRLDFQFVMTATEHDTSTYTQLRHVQVNGIEWDLKENYNGFGGESRIFWAFSDRADIALGFRTMDVLGPLLPEGTVVDGDLTPEMVERLTEFVINKGLMYIHPMDPA